MSAATQFILSYISHNTQMTCEELFVAAKKHGFIPAFDGAEFDI